MSLFNLKGIILLNICDFTLIVSMRLWTFSSSSTGGNGLMRTWRGTLWTSSMESEWIDLLSLPSVMPRSVVVFDMFLLVRNTRFNCVLFRCHNRNIYLPTKHINSSYFLNFLVILPAFTNSEIWLVRITVNHNHPCSHWFNGLCLRERSDWSELLSITRATLFRSLLTGFWLVRYTVNHNKYKAVE